MPVFILFVLVAGQSFGQAENPLRAAPQASEPREPTRRYDSQSWPLPADQPGLSSPPENAVPAIHDVDVHGAAFEEIPSQQPKEKEAKEPAWRLLQANADGHWGDPNRILDLVMRISLNLVFVLSFAVGVILIAKKWVKPKQPAVVADRLRSDSLTILQTLQLDPKISIRLVQWRSNRFLVACDQSGIQSVNPMNASFDQTLGEMDDGQESANLVRRLLANLESNKS
jgi:flagellar biogenesis protein FliO